VALSSEPSTHIAPAAEVIFGIATAWEAPPDAKAWEEALKLGLGSQFTYHEQQVQTHVAVQLGPEGLQNNGPTGLQVIGHRFKTDDGKVVVHFNTGGLSVHRLAPYAGFETVLPIVERCWALFLEVAKPVAVTRLAMRYINVLQLPKQAGQVLDSDRHFKVPFHGPDPATFEARGLHVVYELTDKDTMAPVRCAIATLPTTGELPTWPVALDIEAVLEEQHLLPWQAIQEQLRSLRGSCNRTFDAVLNERPNGTSSTDQAQ
jgi:uncharacterized protein (TIGR04255 family)